MDDWNQQIITEFRATGGKAAQFGDAPLVILHTIGAKSGQLREIPLVALVEGDTLYVFASKGGAPTHPDWYWNMTEAGRAVVEVGTETYDVTVRELEGEARDVVYAEQASRYPGFGEYAEKTAGIRVIPVVALTRVTG
jgi:deazaflavin-dependent oxidoreductase (nitroreductase family)